MKLLDPIKKPLLCIGLLLVCLAGCRYDVADEISPTGNTPACDTLVTYEKIIRPILANNCSQCHSGTAPSANVRLDTYAGTKKVASTGLLLGVVKHSPGFAQMPQGGAKLSDCNISQIDRWIKDESPNN